MPKNATTLARRGVDNSENEPSTVRRRPWRQGAQVDAGAAGQPHRAAPPLALPYFAPLYTRTITKIVIVVTKVRYLKPANINRVAPNSNADLNR